MLKRFALSTFAHAALAACEEPTSDAIMVSPEGLNRAAAVGAEVIAPDVAPQVAINTFANYCARFPANPRGTRNAVEGDGYVLFVSGTEQGLQMFASPDGQPMVATGRQDGAEVCMVLMKEGRDLSRAVESFVNAQHGGLATNIGDLQMPQGTAENVWIVPSDPPVIYFTLVQTQPGIGRVEAIATVTE